MNNHDSKFSSGFLMGIIIGGGAVFLLGTRTGKNLLKILSEQGFDGVLNILEEYDLGGLEEEEYEEVLKEEHKQNNINTNEVREEKITNEVKQTPKKRFFKRIRK